MITKVDYMLFDFFNETFWRRVKAEGDSFKEELKFYTNIMKKVYCNSSHLLKV